MGQEYASMMLTFSVCTSIALEAHSMSSMRLMLRVFRGKLPHSCTDNLSAISCLCDYTQHSSCLPEVLKSLGEKPEGVNDL